MLETYGNITWPPVKTVNCPTGPTGLSKPLPSWLYMKSSFGKSTSEAHIFKIVWSSWPQTMEMKDLRRKSKGSWTRMSGMQFALRRLDGLAFPMVLQEDDPWTSKKSFLKSPSSITGSYCHIMKIVENHRESRFKIAWNCLCLCSSVDNSWQFDQSHEHRACSPTTPLAQGSPWPCRIYSTCRARGQTTKLPPLPSWRMNGLL